MTHPAGKSSLRMWWMIALSLTNTIIQGFVLSRFSSFFWFPCTFLPNKIWCWSLTLISNVYFSQESLSYKPGGRDCQLFTKYLFPLLSVYPASLHFPDLLELCVTVWLSSRSCKWPQHSSMILSHSGWLGWRMIKLILEVRCWRRKNLCQSGSLNAHVE